MYRQRIVLGLVLLVFAAIVISLVVTNAGSSGSRRGEIPVVADVETRNLVRNISARDVAVITLANNGLESSVGTDVQIRDRHLVADILDSLKESEMRIMEMTYPKDKIIIRLNNGTVQEIPCRLWSSFGPKFQSALRELGIYLATEARESLQKIAPTVKEVDTDTEKTTDPVVIRQTIDALARLNGDDFDYADKIAGLFDVKLISRTGSSVTLHLRVTFDTSADNKANPLEEPLWSQFVKLYGPQMAAHNDAPTSTR